MINIANEFESGGGLFSGYQKRMAAYGGGRRIITKRDCKNKFKTTRSGLKS